MANHLKIPFHVIMYSCVMCFVKMFSYFSTSCVNHRKTQSLPAVLTENSFTSDISALLTQPIIGKYFGLLKLTLQASEICFSKHKT